MVKYGANSMPPAIFTDEEHLESFRKVKTNYKLYNRFQIRYLVNDGGDEFKGNPVILQQGTMTGVTEYPIFGLPVDSETGPDEGKKQIRENKVYHQTNDGSPDRAAVNAFNTLMAPYQWSHIGSTVSLGVDFGLRFEILNQVYPTYFIYERQKDGMFLLREQRPQAPRPKDNFKLFPYDPPVMGPAPFIIPAFSFP